MTRLRVKKADLAAARAVAADATIVRRRCALCGKSRRVRQTECCGHTICDDEHKYVMFSYARNSCARNHRQHTLCGYHHTERHKGDWKTCFRCHKAFADVLEMYVYWGTNEYNFEKLPNPPSYEPTHCSQCGKVIVLSEESYSRGPKGIRCAACAEM